MPWGKELFEFERRAVTKNLVEHLKHVLHEFVVTVSNQFEPLFLNVICNGPGVEKNDEINTRQVYACLTTQGPNKRKLLVRTFPYLSVEKCPL